MRVLFNSNVSYRESSVTFINEGEVVKDDYILRNWAEGVWRVGWDVVRCLRF